jgi:two-component system chemotaxis response regulator CheY
MFLAKSLSVNQPFDLTNHSKSMTEIGLSLERPSPGTRINSRERNPRQRILVVDDDLLVRRFHSEMLIYSGYQVDTAKDGAYAWDALQFGNYDLLITDNEMPNMSGVELLKKIQAFGLELPIIMATGAPPEYEFDQYPALQPDAVLLKPYNGDEFLETVKNVLQAFADSRIAIGSAADWRGFPLSNELPLTHLASINL